MYGIKKHEFDFKADSFYYIWPINTQTQFKQFITI